MTWLLGTATDDIDLSVRLAGPTLLKLAVLAVAEGKSIETLTVAALTQMVGRWNAPGRSSTSRNAREGRYVGQAHGKPIRARRKLRRNVRSALARAFLRARLMRRIARRNGTELAVTHLGEQGAR